MITVDNALWVEYTDRKFAVTNLSTRETKFLEISLFINASCKYRNEFEKKFSNAFPSSDKSFTIILSENALHHMDKLIEFIRIDS